MARSFLYGALLVAAALAMIGRPHAYLAFLVGSTCAVHAVFFGEDRYQIVVVPAVALLASLVGSPTSQQPAPNRAR